MAISRVLMFCAAVIFVLGLTVEAQAIKLGGFVIGRYQCAETTPLSNGTSDVQNAKLKLTEELAPNLRFTIQHDFAPNNWQGILNIASLTWDLNSSTTVTLGKQYETG